MSPAAKAYLISGYPRSMRDVVEYTEKVISTFYLILAFNLFLSTDSSPQWSYFNIMASSSASKTN